MSAAVLLDALLGAHESPAAVRPRAKRLHDREIGTEIANAEGSPSQRPAPSQVISTKASQRRMQDAATLRGAIEASGLSYEAIARKLEVPRQHVQDMCEGRRPIEPFHYRALPARVKAEMRWHVVDVPETGKAA